MSLTVDVVVAGSTQAVLETAVDAVRQGQRVLVVLPTDSGTARQFRRDVRKAADTGDRLVVMASAEIVCVEAIDYVEAVLIRHTRTGRLTGVNASAFVSPQRQHSRHVR